MNPAAKPFTWRSRRITTFGDLISTVHAIIEDGSKDEASKFRRAYIASLHGNVSTADSNLGWTMGEFDRDTMQAGLDLFDVSHPIAGRTAVATDREALALGTLWGLGMKLPS